MAKRKDGIERQDILLEAATKIFAEKGFRDATVADICKEANSNIASLNYYFRSKDNLYAQVWKNAFQKTLAKYPLDMNLSKDAPPESALKAFIESLLHKVLDSGQLGYAGQILIQEMSNATGKIETVKEDAIQPVKNRMRGIIKEILGEKSSDEQIAFCALSVVHQCISFGFRRGNVPHPLNQLDKDELFNSLLEHITLFSLAGIQAVKEKIDKHGS